MIETMKNRYIMYNDEKSYIKEKEASGDVFVLRPNAPLNISAVEKDENELERVYQHGRQIATDNLEALKRYFQE